MNNGICGEIPDSEYDSDGISVNNSQATYVGHPFLPQSTDVDKDNDDDSVVEDEHGASCPSSQSITLM